MSREVAFTESGISAAIVCVCVCVYSAQHVHSLGLEMGGGYSLTSVLTSVSDLTNPSPILRQTPMKNNLASLFSD